MKSGYYIESVNQGRAFQKQNKTWSGMDSVKWAESINKNLLAHDCTTVLDYGCGKGVQYRDPVKDNMSLDKYWGVRVDLYDPCVEGLDHLSGIVYDAVITTQALGCVPDLDVPWVIDVMASRARKLLFIGILDLGYVKDRKSRIRDPEAYLDLRDEQWYLDRLSHIKDISVVLEYRTD